MRLWIGERRGTIVALAAGLLLRALFVGRHAAFSGDTLIYGDLAHNMIAHHVYGLTENVVRPTLIRLPGYPVFLAACFLVFGVGNYLAVLWVQVAVGLVTCWMLGKLAGRIFGRGVGVATLWLAALCPFTANYDAAALAECWSLFCVVLAFFALERWRAALRRGEEAFGWTLVVGFALMYAVMLRPEQGLLAVALIPAMIGIGIFEGRSGISESLRPAMLASMVLVIPMLLWGARNWSVFHVVQPLAPKYANDPGEFVSYGFTRWYKTWGAEYVSTTNTYWVYDGGPLRVQDLPERAFDSAAQRQETAEAYAAYNNVTTATPAVDAQFAKLADERVRGHWLRYRVAMPVAREADMWLRPRTEFMKLPLEWWRFSAHPGPSFLCLGYAALDWVLLGLAVLGLRRARGNGVFAGMVAFVVLRCLLLLTLDNAEQRYTLECLPVVILLAAVAIAKPTASPSSIALLESR